MGTSFERVMTFNLRYDNADDGPDAWPKRKNDVCIFLLSMQPDFLGCQEALYDQVMDLDAALSPVGYKWSGVGRDDGHKAVAGEFNPIFYNAHRFKLLTQGVFWLSLTPDEPGTKFPGAGCNRICQYGLFEKVPSGEQVWHFNTHLDNESAPSRVYATELILKRIHELVTDPAMPYFLTGDFNSEKKSRPYEIINGSDLTDSEELAAQKYPGCTFIGFDDSYCEIIDFIFLANQRSVLDYVVDKATRPNGRNLSDHRPVHTDLQLFPAPAPSQSIAEPSD